MSLSSVVGSSVYYLVLPFITLFNVFLIFFAPFTHLLTFVWHGILFPLHFFEQLETLHIYFGVAALIGLLMGFILYVSSTMLVSLLDLHPSPIGIDRTVISARAAREKSALGDAWRTLASTRSNQRKTLLHEVPGKGFVKSLDKDRDRRELQGLLPQTILEEDDSEDGS